MRDLAVLERRATGGNRMPRHHAALQRAVAVMEHALEPLPPQDLEAFAAQVEGIVDTPDVTERNEFLLRTLGAREYSREERVQLEYLSLLTSFQRRRKLLENALSTSQVAELLGTSRQTPYDRAKSGTLIAISDRGTLRFPPWQFDPESADGVIAGLPAVLRALRASTLGKISWLVRSNPYLENATPLDSLKRGQVERVVELAHGVART